MEAEFIAFMDRVRDWTTKHGTVKYGVVNGHLCVPVFFYEDDVISVSSHRYGKEMEIERKENKNPVVMTREDGSILRYHGEFRFIRDHLEKLTQT